jgi:WhiB family redox-sensing transcriptional regulator
MPTPQHITRQIRVLELLAERGACSGYPTEWWYPGGSSDEFKNRPSSYEKYAQRAKQICAECPVRDECLTYALDFNENYGIWGGFSPRSRITIKRRRRRGLSDPPIFKPIGRPRKGAEEGPQ